MKKKFIALGLLSLLTLNVPAFANPHGGPHGGHHGGCGPAHVRIAPPPPPHCHRGHFGVSFSTGVLARRGYWSPYNYDYCQIGYPFFNGYYTYPPCYTPNVYVNLGL